MLGLEEPIPSGSISSRSGGYESEWAAMAHGSPLERRTRRRVESRFGAEIEAFGYDVDDLQVRSDDWRKSLP
jgi:hypothetical protein